jgi:ABC-2 type transport system ATP-binding protein
MIHVENLTKYYKDFCAVNQVNFDIRKGEILGLLGPNGAGKTTTLRMLTGFLRPTSGNVRVKEFTLAEHPLDIKRLMGYLPESAPLYPEMIAYDYLGFVADLRDLHGKAKYARIGYLADLCGLREVMHQPIGELSKGYKQRVGLAHAMMNDPEILILDEPTSGLDPNQIAEIRQIIRRIGREKTIILSTHILSEAEATCDRIIIIHRGQIAVDGTTETLKQSAGGRKMLHIALKNADIQAVQRELAPLGGVLEIDPPDPTGLLRATLSSPSGEDLREAVYQRIKAGEWVLFEFRQESQTLETIFRELTREN